MIQKDPASNFTYQVGDKIVKLTPTEVDLKQEPQSGIDKVLEARGKLYGNFAAQAAISHELKFVMRDVTAWDGLMPFQQEALEMIQHKIARILNGDSTCIDSWLDIAGYATLVVNELRLEARLKREEAL
jgi:hypothetical protein